MPRVLKLSDIINLMENQGFNHFSLIVITIVLKNNDNKIFCSYNKWGGEFQVRLEESDHINDIEDFWPKKWDLNLQYFHNREPLYKKLKRDK